MAAAAVVNGVKAEPDPVSRHSICPSGNVLPAPSEKLPVPATDRRQLLFDRIVASMACVSTRGEEIGPRQRSSTTGGERERKPDADALREMSEKPARPEPA